jgi:predicted alpha/beta superfamily hydrolase
MKKLFLLFVYVNLCSLLFGQYSLRIVVTDAATKQQEDIYVAGNFNNWNPADPSFKMKPFGGTRRVYVLKDIAPGKYEFKFTRGSWDKVETTAKGEDLENHIIEVNSDTSVTFSVAGWHDAYPVKPKPNTASAQVQVLDTAFFMPQLNRNRRIWVYLPKNYQLLKSKSYPVLYMQDGQNLFNEQTAAFGEWGIDECLDTLQQQLNKECIVVGIDNGGERRINEYDPFDTQQYGKGQGDAYVDFLALVLKPYIDKHFRTLKDAQHTFIAGSSVGALISLYAVAKYPEVYSSAGIFSPSFWIAPQMFNNIQQKKWNGVHRFFFYAGGKEAQTMIPDMKKMEGLLYESKDQVQTREVIFPLGQHNETYWRKIFPEFYKWLMQ